MDPVEQQPGGSAYTYDASAPPPGAPSQELQPQGYAIQQGGATHPMNPAVPQQGAYPQQMAYEQKGDPAYGGGTYPPPGTGQPDPYGGGYPQQQPDPYGGGYSQPVAGYPAPNPQYPPPPPTYDQQGQSSNIVVVQAQPTVTHVQQYSDSGDATMGFTLALAVTIFALICGCWWALICSIPAMVISLTSQDAARRGDYDSVRRSRNISLALSLAAIVSSIVAVVVLVVIIAV